MSLIPSRFGLRATVMTGAAVVSTFTVVVGVNGIAATSTANRDADALYDASVKPLDMVGDARASFNDNGTLAESHLLETDPAQKAKLFKAIRTEDFAIGASLAEARGDLDGTVLAPKIDALKAKLTAYRKARDRVL